jgi:hypothetical protein
VQREFSSVLPFVAVSFTRLMHIRKFEETQVTDLY